MRNDEKNSRDRGRARHPPFGRPGRVFSQLSPAKRKNLASTRQAFNAPSQAGKFARHQIAVDYSSVDTAHQFRLSLLVCDDCFIPLAARDSRLHSAQKRPNSRNPRPIDLAASFRLSNALFGGNVLGHCPTLLEVHLAAVPPCNHRISTRQPDRERAPAGRGRGTRVCAVMHPNGLFRAVCNREECHVRRPQAVPLIHALATAPASGSERGSNPCQGGATPPRDDCSPGIPSMETHASGYGTAPCAFPQTPPSPPSGLRWRTRRETSGARNGCPPPAWSRTRG